MYFANPNLPDDFQAGRIFQSLAGCFGPSKMIRRKNNKNHDFFTGFHDDILWHHRHFLGCYLFFWTAIWYSRNYMIDIFLIVLVTAFSSCFHLFSADLTPCFQVTQTGSQSCTVIRNGKGSRRSPTFRCLRSLGRICIYIYICLYRYAYIYMYGIYIYIPAPKVINTEVSEQVCFEISTFLYIVRFDESRGRKILWVGNHFIWTSFKFRDPSEKSQIKGLFQFL